MSAPMPERTNNLSQLAISDQGFIFDPSTGQSYTTNDQGRLIINALGKNEPAQVILGQILDRFQVSSREAESDLEDFMDQLRCLGLVANG